MTDIRQKPAWRDLGRLAAQMNRARVDSMFAHDPQRAERFTLSAAGITLDYSKQRVDQAVMDALGRLADAQQFDAAREALFAGAPINNSEGRAAWHMALRRPAGAPLHDAVHEVRAEMAAFVDDVRRGRWVGYTGAPISDVVNIGIGGSDLGPRLICDALAQLRQRIHCHFVANVDPADLDDTLIRMDPERTLFIVTSKSFGTAETLANASVARQWLLDNGADTTRQDDRGWTALHWASAAGDVGAFAIMSKDTYGNNRWEGGDAFEVLMVLADDADIAVRGSVEDFHNGSYLVTYTVPVKGFYEMKVTLDGENVRTCTSPVSSTVTRTGQALGFWYDRNFNGRDVYYAPSFCTQAAPSMGPVAVASVITALA